MISQTVTSVPRRTRERPNTVTRIGFCNRGRRPGRFLKRKECVYATIGEKTELGGVPQARHSFSRVLRDR